jgi:N-acetylmuramoyl-L-alanine amidase
VAWATVNLREGPGTKYKVVAKVKKGTLLTILEEKEGWYHVRSENGKEAWISKTATSEGVKAHAPSGSSPSPPASPTSSTAVQSVKPESPM